MTQDPARPTVGDTVTVVHRVLVPAGAVVQARAPADSTIATMIGPPNLTREGDSVRVAYTVALWAPGKNDLVFPGAVVVGLDGKVDTLPDAHMALDVASVLPAGKAASAVPPRAAQPWLPRADQTMLPLIVLLPLALIFVALIQWLARRRGPRPGSPPPAVETPITLTAERLEQWLAAGEARLALEHLEHRLRGAPDLADWRARADAVRFAAGDGPELEALVREGWALAGRGRGA